VRGTWQTASKAMHISFFLFIIKQYQWKELILNNIWEFIHLMHFSRVKWWRDITLDRFSPMLIWNNTYDSLLFTKYCKSKPTDTLFRTNHCFVFQVYFGNSSTNPHCWLLHMVMHGYGYEIRQFMKVMKVLSYSLTWKS
jgi:hypothetical protein